MHIFKNIFFTYRFYLCWLSLVLVFIAGYAFDLLFSVGQFGFFLIVVLTIAEAFTLFSRRYPVKARRFCAERFSNGLDNPVHIHLENSYPFNVDLAVADEMPEQFQLRDTWFRLTMKPGENRRIEYSLRPVERGTYNFGLLRVFAGTSLGLVRRRINLGESKEVAVYPAFHHLRKFELLVFSNKLQNAGLKKIRRIGQSREFEQIQNYVAGDDYRNINWKATAKKGDLMVNNYQDEKSQQIYCLIDKGRVMQMPFNGLSLLDYSINASLILVNTAIRKGDKAGLITFAQKAEDILIAEKNPSRLHKVLEVLYKQKTTFKESDFEPLYTAVRRRITQRSLLVLFTNFETLGSMERQLSYLRQLSKFHLLLVVFFENTEMLETSRKETSGIESVALKAVAEKFIFEKRRVVKELNKYGIHAVLTSPEQVIISTVNKYLEFKSRGLI